MEASRALPNALQASALRRAWATALLAGVTCVRATAPLQPAALATLRRCRLESLCVGTLRSIHREVLTTLADVASLPRLRHLQLDPSLVGPLALNPSQRDLGLSKVCRLQPCLCRLGPCHA